MALECPVAIYGFEPELPCLMGSGQDGMTTSPNGGRGPALCWFFFVFFFFWGTEATFMKSGQIFFLGVFAKAACV